MSRIFLIFATKINKYNMGINCIYLSDKDIETLKNKAISVHNNVLKGAKQKELLHNIIFLFLILFSNSVILELYSSLIFENLSNFV